MQYPRDYLIDRLKENLKRLEGLFRGHVVFYWGNVKSLGPSISDNLITNEDLEIFRDMLYKRTFKDDLYLIITSPGGKIEAAESIMKYLDAKTENLYAIVPFMAKSAATLLCLMANKIFMGYYSILGSISPLVGAKYQDAIQILDEFDRIMNFYSQPASVQEIIQRQIQKLNSKASVQSNIEKDASEVGLSVPNNVYEKDAHEVGLSVPNNIYEKDAGEVGLSGSNKEDIQIVQQVFSSLFIPLIKTGYPLYEAERSIEWVIDLAYWALNRGKTQRNKEDARQGKKQQIEPENGSQKTKELNGSDQIPKEGQLKKGDRIDHEIIEMLNHLLLQRSLKFHHRNISIQYAKEIRLPVELLEDTKYKEHESLILSCQNIMRILAERFDIQKLIASSNGQVYYKIKKIESSVQEESESEATKLENEDRSPNASCTSVDSSKSNVFHSNSYDSIALKQQKEKEFDSLKQEAEKTRDYSKIINFVIKNVERYS